MASSHATNLGGWNTPTVRRPASRHQRTGGFSSEPATAGLPPLSPVSPRRGARRAATSDRSARASGAAGGRKHVGGSAAGPSGQGRALGAGQGKTSRPCAAEPIWRSQRGGDGRRQRRVGVRQRAVRLADRHRPRGRGRRLGHAKEGLLREPLQPAELRRLLCDGHQALVPRREALDRRETTRHRPGVLEQLQPLDRLSLGTAVLAEHVADDRDVHVEGGQAILACELLDERRELGVRLLGWDEPAGDGGRVGGWSTRTATHQTWVTLG